MKLNTEIKLSGSSLKKANLSSFVSFGLFALLVAVILYEANFLYGLYTNLSTQTVQVSTTRTSLLNFESYQKASQRYDAAKIYTAPGNERGADPFNTYTPAKPGAR